MGEKKAEGMETRGRENVRGRLMVGRADFCERREGEKCQRGGANPKGGGGWVVLKGRISRKGKFSSRRKFGSQREAYVTLQGKEKIR